MFKLINIKGEKIHEDAKKVRENVYMSILVSV
jgi:hypothetical protein